MGNLADGGAVFGFGFHRIELECLMAAMTEGIVLRVLKRLTVAAPFMRVRPPRPTAMVLWTFYFLYYCCPSLSCHAIGLNWSDVLSLTRFAHTRNIVLPIEGFSLWHAFVVGSADGWTPSNNSKRIFDLLVLEKTMNLQAFIRRRDIVSERLQLLRFPSLFITHRSLYLLIYIYFEMERMTIAVLSAVVVSFPSRVSPDGVRGMLCAAWYSTTTRSRLPGPRDEDKRPILCLLLLPAAKGKRVLISHYMYLHIILSHEAPRRSCAHQGTIKRKIMKTEWVGKCDFPAYILYK